MSNEEMVESLKKVYGEKITADPSSIRLFYAGKELVDGLGLYAYEIIPEILVVAMVKLPQKEDEAE